MHDFRLVVDISRFHSKRRALSEPENEVNSKWGLTHSTLLEVVKTG